MKFDSIHGLYKIPLGVVLIWVAAVNIPYLAAMLEIQFSIHDICLIVGVKSLVEGLHDLFHNPVKKEALKVLAREEYIATKITKAP